MLHRNTLIAISALFCAIAVGAGLFVADMNKQSGVIAQQPGLSGTSQPAAAPTQAAPEADTPTASEPAPTSAPAVAIEPTEPPATSQPEPTNAPSAIATPSGKTAEYIEYTVQKGDLLNSIAKKYNVTTKQILAINEISNADSLTVGQVLRIPKV
ncbi:MAG TPA: LysM peptidoglycan-binding domain-containing protein [Roseiflexaceae bacterium]|nr:LysM peptidoglycan-binding domain-containing protein [Roseiflexaceae bacterium]